MPEDQTPDKGTEQVAPTVTEPEETVQTPEVEPEQPTPEPAPEVAPAEPDYKDKFRYSASEALILNAQNKQQESLLKKLTSQDAPTEAELLAEYPQYNEFDANSKKFVVDLLTTKKRQARQELEIAKGEAERKWQEEYRGLVSNPKYSSLAGDRGFESFVFQPKHRGLDIETLADAYLMRTGKTPVDETPTAPQRQEILPTGSGPRGTPKKQKLSIEEASVLKQTNWKEYTRLLNMGMIDDGI